MKLKPVSKFNNHEEYIALQCEPAQSMLKQVREAVKAIIPDAEEVISYQMPAFRLRTIIVWYAAFTNHIGFYPTASGIEAFKDELAPYKSSKGAVQFPFGKPLPLELISRIVRFRVEEEQGKGKTKKLINQPSKQ